ncbi:MerR family DNA-binding transcriptional regulator, partial [uncultured Bradyrhizobium sp.]
MRIGELANVVGLSPDTIRYYERVDLLPPPARTPSG